MEFFVNGRRGEQVMVNNLQMTDTQFGLRAFLDKKPIERFADVDDFVEPKD